MLGGGQQHTSSSQAGLLPAAAWASLVPGLTAASWAASAARAAAAEEAAPEAAGAALQAAAEQVVGTDCVLALLASVSLPQRC